MFKELTEKIAYPTVEHEILAFWKERQHGEHRAALDDDVEQIALARQPTLCNQQMARRRNRQKLGDTLNDPE